jgi:hypothetical protein
MLTGDTGAGLSVMVVVTGEPGVAAASTIFSTLVSLEALVSIEICGTYTYTRALTKHIYYSYRDLLVSTMSGPA